MLRIVEYIIYCTYFYDFSRIHDGDAIGHIGDDPEVMRDEYDGGLGMLLNNLSFQGSEPGW